MGSGELKRLFGRRIQGLRESKGLTQEQLAERIGRTVDTVGNIERGINGTRIEVAYLIATELGVRLPDLFAFEEVYSKQSTASKTTDVIAKMLDECDEGTASDLLDLIRVGLRLTTPR